jgi:hypothetical protein
MEFALEDNKRDNDRCQQIREAYQFVDNEMGWVERRGGVDAKLAEALTVGSFPTYFARTISRLAYDRYNYRRGQWRDYTYPDQLPDYSAGTRWRWTEFDRPVLRDAKAEAYAGYMYPEYVTVGVNDYAKQVDFSRRVLINDDLGQFNSIGMRMGDSARRFEDFFVSALYHNATTIGGTGLIVAGANYYGTGALTTANLMIAWNAFAQRVDVRGNPLNIQPRYLVIPPILRLTANTILESERIAELATNAKNVLRGLLEVKEDPYITFTLPNVPWWLFADPNDVPGVSVVRRTGVAGPELFALAPDKVPMSAAGALGTADWRTGSFLTGDIELMIETCIGGRTDVQTSFGALLMGITDIQGVYLSVGTTP